MLENIGKTLEKDLLTKEDVLTLLSAGEKADPAIYRKAAETKARFVGKKVYFRGIIHNIGDMHQSVMEQVYVSAEAIHKRMG